MNNIQNRNGSIREGKRRVAWAVQGNVIKGNKRFSLRGFVGGGESKLSCDVKAESAIRLLKCM